MLNVQPEDVLFVGDDLEKDIAGPQNVNIKGYGLILIESQIRLK